MKKSYKIVAVIAVIAVFSSLLAMMQTGVIGLKALEITDRGIFDAEFSYYSADYFYETVALIEQYGGNSYHVFHVFDCVFLVSYYFLMAFMTAGVLPIKKKKLAYLIALPAPIFDLMENISIEALIAIYPKQVGYAAFAGALTCLKWYSGFAWFIVFLILSAVKIIKSRKKSLIIP